MHEAISVSGSAYAWHNEGHRHSGLDLLTPAMVHHGEAPAVIERRQVVLDAAYQSTRSALSVIRPGQSRFQRRCGSTNRHKG